MCTYFCPLHRATILPWRAPGTGFGRVCKLPIEWPAPVVKKHGCIYMTCHIDCISKRHWIFISHDRRPPHSPFIDVNKSILRSRDFFFQKKNCVLTQLPCRTEDVETKNVNFNSDSERRSENIPLYLFGGPRPRRKVTQQIFLPPTAEDDLKCCAPGRNKKVNDEPRINPKEASHSIDC